MNDIINKTVTDDFVPPDLPEKTLFLNGDETKEKLRIYFNSLPDWKLDMSFFKQLDFNSKIDYLTNNIDVFNYLYKTDQVKNFINNNFQSNISLFTKKIINKLNPPLQLNPKIFDLIFELNEDEFYEFLTEYTNTYILF